MRLPFASEDPATGGAATALAAYLARRENGETTAHRWTVEQGVEMGRPSTLYLEADVDTGAMVPAIRVGGARGEKAGWRFRR
ncbi:MAG: PhzF family phenazine biosynthesis protein [Gemmatimonadetes bacterium]|nr:PhzF family phenazine biosynthesis protein [Gemmatimonadota bacterium]